MKRKDFLRNGALFTAGLSLYSGCTDDNPTEPSFVSEEPPFPYLEVSEISNYNIGYRIGEHFQMNIQELYSRQFADKQIIPGSPFDGMSLLEILLFFVDSDPATFYDPFYNAAQSYFPDYTDELKGMSDASAIPFKYIFTGMCILEILSLISNSTSHSIPAPTIKGCSTVSYSDTNKLFLAHNEDFMSLHSDLMYVVKVSQPGKPTFMSLSYPGSILGIPPGMNDAGMVFSGNQIDLPVASAGVPFVFLSRAILQARSIDEAKSIVQFSHLAYGTHLNIGSFTEQKIISAEVMPGQYEIHDVDGFYAHTNHFILPSMQGSSVIDENSVKRREMLLTKSNEYANRPNDVTGDLITGWMSSHDGYPDAVCVHNNSGLTIAHSLFDFQNKTWKLYRGNPCNNAYKTLTL